MQPGALLPEPYSALTATAQTVCFPAGTATVEVNMCPGCVPPEPFAVTVVTCLLSTSTCTLIGLVVSGSVAQPVTTAFAPC